MFSLLVLSTLIFWASAADESKEIQFVSRLSRILAAETTKGATELAAFWDKNEKTDQESVDAFLKGVETEVFEKVKKDVVGLVMNSLGEMVIKPEGSDMYNVLKEIVDSFIREITLGRAKSLSKNKDIQYEARTKDGANKLSKSIANFYDGIMNKNVTEEEKTKLIGKSQEQIDNFINLTIKADRKSSKLASRSGLFMFNQQLEQQQQKSTSSVAQKLVQQMSTNLCGSQSQYLPQVQSDCNVVCHPHCTHCNSGLGSSFNRYNHLDLQHGGSGNERYGGLGSNGLVGTGYSNTGSSNFGHYGSSHQSSHNSHSSSFGLSGSSGSSSSHLGVYGTLGSGLGEAPGSSYGSPYGSHGNSFSDFKGSNSGSSLGTYGKSFNDFKDSSSGSNFGIYGSHGNGLSGFQGTGSGSHSGVYGSQGTGVGELKGTHSGIANLWSLSPAGNSGSSFGGSNFGGSSLGGSSLYGGSSYSGGLPSNNHHIGDLGNTNTFGHQVGGLGGARNSGYYSSSKSSSSSSSDRAASQTAYGSSGNIW